MATDLSKKEWVIGLFSIGFLGLIIVGRIGSSSAAAQPKMTYSIKGTNFKNCDCAI